MSNAKQQDFEMDDDLTDRETSQREPFLLQPIQPVKSWNNGGAGNFLDSPGAAILAYCFSSISMTVVNKFVVSGSAWNLNWLYLAIQAAICTAAIVVLKTTKFIPNIAALETTKIKRWLPVSVAFTGMIYTSTKSLQFLSVPVYTIFKNLTIIVIAYGEVLWFGGRVTPLLLLSFGVMVLSSIVAAWSDIAAALAGQGDAATSVATVNAGYAWMAVNLFCTASYVLGTRKFIQTLNFKDWDTMFYNNIISLPIMLVFSFLTEDLSFANLAKNFPADSRQSLLIGMFYSGLGAIFISYTTAWCIRKTSSTTYSFVGYLNKLPLSISGIVFFHTPVTLGGVVAILLGFVSGLVYGYGKMRQKQDQQSQPVLPTAHTAISASSRSQKDAA